MNAAASLKERVLASAAVTPSPTRPQWKRLAGGLLAVSVAMGIALFELAGGLAHSLAGRPIVLSVRLADGWGLGSAALTFWVARKSTPFVRSADALVALPLACPALMLAWVSHFHGAYPEPPAGADWPCFLGTTAIAATPVTLFLWLRRGGEPRHPRALAASIACVCAAWAGVLVLLWCPLTNPSHVVSGHVAPLVLLSGLGWLFGGPALALRTPLVVSQRPSSHPSRQQRGRTTWHPTVMSLSMRTLLAANPALSEETRIGIANRDPESARRLVQLGLDECEAAELLDESCEESGE